MIKNDANAPPATVFYKDLLSEIKSRVRKAQNRLATVANTGLLALYCGILADYWLIVKKWKDGGRVF